MRISKHFFLIYKRHLQVYCVFFCFPGLLSSFAIHLWARLESFSPEMSSFYIVHLKAMFLVTYKLCESVFSVNVNSICSATGAKEFENRTVNMYGKMIVFELLSSKWKPQISDYAEQKRLKIQEYICARKMTLHPKGWSNQYVCETSAVSAP